MRPELPVRPDLALLLSVFSLFACGGPPGPAALDTKNDACAWCRMGASDARFAAQLVAPREEPRFFDDIGCLAAFLAATPAPKESEEPWTPDADELPPARARGRGVPGGRPGRARGDPRERRHDLRGSPMTLLLCARQELVLAVRSRWT